MKIYLDKNVTQIKVFKDLVLLMQKLIDSDIDAIKTINSVDDIYKLSKIDDPVKDFLNYYITEGGINKPDGWLDYASCNLYESKGSTKVIENLAELLNIGVEYHYEFPVLELIQFTELTVTNLNEFISRLDNMLNYLLLFTEINIEVKKLILSIVDTLTYYTVSSGNNFRVTTVEVLPDGELQ